MIDGTRTKQKGNVVQGHQAGRDVNVYQLARSESALGALMEWVQSEMEVDPGFCEIVETLQHFRDPNADDSRDLETKLVDTGRAQQLSEALKLKEAFFKLMQKHLVRESAQRTLGHLLGVIWQRFNQEVRPLIDRGESALVVDAAILSKVISPVVQELGPASVLVQSLHISGMLYYLAGNCHIRWD